jgi:pimeloyl-ACP methyl ester carboxylesterase
VLGLLGVSWREAWIHAHPPRHPVGAPPADFPGPLTEVSFQTADHITLRGWYSADPEGKRAIVLLHPYGSNRTTMLSRARLYRAEGIGVLLYDARGCGNSGGDISSVGYYEAEDLVAALQWLRAQGVTEIICQGWSQGGSTILMAAERLGDVKGVVLEAAFDSMEHAIDRAFRHRVRLPGKVAGVFFTPILEQMLHMRVSAFRPVDHAWLLECPVLVIAGENDQSTWQVDTQDIFHALRGEKQLWLVPNATHEDLYAFQPNVYRRTVMGFVLQCFAKHQ